MDLLSGHFSLQLLFIQERLAQVIEGLEADLASKSSAPAPLVSQRARLAEAQASAAETEQAKAAYRAETQRQLNDRHAQAASRAHVGKHGLDVGGGVVCQHEHNFVDSGVAGEFAQPTE